MLMVLLAAAAAALAAPPPHEQPVAFDAQHDPSVVTLADGRALQVRYDGVSWSAVGAWTPGRPLVLTYSSDRGMALLDPGSGDLLTVHTIEGGPHLLDVWTDACLEQAVTTASMERCLGQGVLRWSAEVDRLWAVAQAPAAQAAWQAHRDAEFDLIMATYGGKDGTIWRVSAGQAKLRVVRDQGLRLGRLLADADLGG